MNKLGQWWLEQRLKWFIRKSKIVYISKDHARVPYYQYIERVVAGVKRLGGDFDTVVMAYLIHYDKAGLSYMELQRLIGENDSNKLLRVRMFINPAHWPDRNEYLHHLKNDKSLLKLALASNIEKSMHFFLYPEQKEALDLLTLKLSFMELDNITGE